MEIRSPAGASEQLRSVHKRLVEHGEQLRTISATAWQNNHQPHSVGSYQSI